ncbi:hypothetical protein DAR30_24895, partial [Salmonella enterica subsp. enterica serovar Enteritidis]|nr:hypothetical protein [Salmonella enterica subsp. enterica serovar Enteritidis]
LTSKQHGIRVKGCHRDFYARDMARTFADDRPPHMQSAQLDPFTEMLKSIATVDDPQISGVVPGVRRSSGPSCRKTAEDLLH